MVVLMRWGERERKVELNRHRDIELQRYSDSGAPSNKFKQN